MADEAKAQSASSPIQYALPVSAIPQQVTASSAVCSIPEADNISSPDSRTRQALADRLDVTNVAARAVSIANVTPSATMVTCAMNSGPASAKGNSAVTSVAPMTLTEFHLPHVTSVIDAATNSLLPNAANKSATAKFQEQLMLGAAQRITSGPASTKGAARSTADLPVTASVPTLGTHPTSVPASVEAAAPKSSGPEVHQSDSPAYGPTGGDGLNGAIPASSVVRAPSIAGSRSSQAKAAHDGPSLVNPASAMSPASLPPQKQSPSPYPNTPEVVAQSAQAVPIGGAAAIGAAAARSPPILPAGAVQMGGIAVPASGVIPAGTVFSGQGLQGPGTAAEGHAVSMNANQFVGTGAQAAVLPTSAAGQVAVDGQHRSIFPYIFDPEAIQNGFSPGVYVGAVSTAGQFVPQGMAMCAPAIMPSAPGARPHGNAVQPMYRAVMMPGMVQLDGSNPAASQYYYQEILSAAQQQMNKMMQPAMITPRMGPGSTGHAAEAGSGRHSQATSPTSSPLPGILRKRNHDGSRKAAGGGAVASSSSLTAESMAVNGDGSEPVINPDISRLSSKGKVHSPPLQLLSHAGRSASSLSTIPSNGPKSLHASVSRTGNLPSASGLSSTASHSHSRPGVKAVTSSYPEISPRKKPRKQQVVATEDPLSSNVPTGKSLLDASSARMLNLPTKTPAVHAPKPQKEGIHQFPFRRRMLVGYGGGYMPRGKVAYNHFTRSSDVRIKEEKRPTLADVVSKFSHVKDHADLLQGCKVRHLIANIDAICALEQEKADHYSARSVDKKWKEEPDLEEEVEGIIDLCQGNIQRSKALIEQLTEVKQTLLKSLDHLPRVQDLMARHANQKTRKKSSHSSTSTATSSTLHTLATTPPV